MKETQHSLKEMIASRIPCVLTYLMDFTLLLRNAIYGHCPFLSGYLSGYHSAEDDQNIKRVQETTAEVISRLSDYLGSPQVINETGIQVELAGGSDMAPRKRKAASKRKVRDFD